MELQSLLTSVTIFNIMQNIINTYLFHNWYNNLFYLVKLLRLKISVEFRGFSPTSCCSMIPVGTIRSSPSGVKVNRRKNVLMVSSWNKWTGFDSASVPGNRALETLDTIRRVVVLNIRHTLKNTNISQCCIIGNTQV